MPSTTPCSSSESQKCKYQSGINNTFESEAEGYQHRALPKHRNNPKVCPLNLYAEQLSGTAFTVNRSKNRRTWLYRRLPSCAVPVTDIAASTGQEGSESGGIKQKKNEKEGRLFRSLNTFFGHCDLEKDLSLDPNPLRWMPPRTRSHSTISSNPLQNDSANVDFVEGTYTMAASGNPVQKSGLAIHIYNFNANMRRSRHCKSDVKSNAHVRAEKYMYNSDGDFLIVPQSEALFVETELGHMIVRPREICVLPRGIVFSVNIRHEAGSQEEEEKKEVHGGGNEKKMARGYILEIFQGHFDLPELGPIGSNGLANARDFLVPVAAFDDDDDDVVVDPPSSSSSPSTSSLSSATAQTTHLIVNKFGNQLFQRQASHSPFNVVAWHGNYVPFKYNLDHFCCINSVTYDHPDPSIYTVLTVPSSEEGTALADFVVFPPRYQATDDNTFRPPWYHRNCMAEFMGLIDGQYDAKVDGGFVPGGCSLHNIMTPHGPDAHVFEKATSDGEKNKGVEKFEGGMAFMFETKCLLQLSSFAKNSLERDGTYAFSCWEGLKDHFAAAD